jgi:cytochrome c oxidase assembly protein subunit 15
MSLEAFKGIFWWEYCHRLLGRAIGSCSFVPLLYFAIRAKLNGALVWRLAVIFVLGGLQGALGWYMVKSGLVDDPRVSQYRLTAHSGLAFLIYAAMLWTALGLLSPDGRRSIHYGADVIVSAGTERADLSDGAVRRAGRGHPRGACVQHVSADERTRRSAEYFMLEPWCGELLQQHGGRAVRSRLIAWVLFVDDTAILARHARSATAATGAARVQSVADCARLADRVGNLDAAAGGPAAAGAAHQAGALILFTGRDLDRARAGKNLLRSRLTPRIGSIREPRRFRILQRFDLELRAELLPLAHLVSQRRRSQRIFAQPLRIELDVKCPAS